VRRLSALPRVDLDARAAALGFTFKDVDGVPYWDESVCYAFTLAEIEADLEEPASALSQLCLELAGRAVHDRATLLRLGVPERAHRLVAESWERRDPTLYGRFDLAYDGAGPAKMLEYSADTPTSLYETAVFQWFWLEDLKARGDFAPEIDQFNGVHEALVARWREILNGDRLHLAALPNLEDGGTIAYLADCAAQAGSVTELLAMREIGLHRGRLVDLRDQPIRWLFKLYPWEWMLEDAFGRSGALAYTAFVEPPWKMMLSTKAILPFLWEMAPGHPNLLPAFFEDDPRSASLGDSFARKPIHSREGANVTLVRDSEVQAQTQGSYGRSPCIRQALAPAQPFNGYNPVIGAWIVGDQACGIGIREDAGLVTSNRSRFVPHVIAG
jgi:glutathionylspermidine synthase